MRKNRSPWIHQLNKDRSNTRLEADLKTDVVIVGAGIAGVSSAFFTLKYTDKNVVLIEKFKLAHGATGHNAGQVAGYFEIGFRGLVERFGLQLAKAGHDAVMDGWELLEEMYKDAGLDIFFDRGVGRDGYSTYEQVLEVLEESRLKREAGVSVDQVYIAGTAPFIDSIPEEYVELYNTVPHAQVLEMLDTENPMFLAVNTDKRGCINSALFCERMSQYLLGRYKERFALYEHTAMQKIILHTNEALLDVGGHAIVAEKVVLCTNGFENFHIINDNGLEVDAKYHHLVHGRVAYMSAYLEPADKPPVETSYETPDLPLEDLPYYYLTRRPYEYEAGTKHNLVSVGGPEEPFEDAAQYSRESEYPERAMEQISSFVKDVYLSGQARQLEYEFTWHGLMGYTPNRVRLIGEEPKNPVLLYNLGCNGIGIIPSIFGGRRISRIIAGENVKFSIFDPKG